MNIVLIGYRGVGKSSVGRSLALRLGRNFVDTDDLLEEGEGAAIGEIVRSRGWDYFRAVEKRIVREVSAQDGLVIAPGGGAVLDPENAQALRRNGLVVWLQADPSTLMQRMSRDPANASRRPSLTEKKGMEELIEVMTQREGIYARVAAIKMETSHLEVAEVADRVFLTVVERIG